MSTENVDVDPRILDLAETIQGVSEDEKKYFVCTAAFLQGEMLRQLAEGFPEIVRIANKVGESGEKPKKADVTSTIRIDLTNPQMLNVKLQTSVSPYKLIMRSEASDDMRQLKLDFDGHKVTRETTIQTEGEEDELDGKTVAELHVIAERLEIEVPSKSTKKAIIALIKEHQIAQAGEGREQPQE